MDAAIARICGEMIIEQVDQGIRDIYREHMIAEKNRISEELAKSEYFVAS